MAERRLGLADKLARVFPDRRASTRVVHSLVGMQDVNSNWGRRLNSESARRVGAGPLSQTLSDMDDNRGGSAAGRHQAWAIRPSPLSAQRQSIVPISDQIFHGLARCGIV